jgi:glutamine synthetase
LPLKIEQHAETLARECAAKAAEAGIPMEDIQEEVGDIQELIASRLEDAVEIDEDTHGDASTGDRAA